VHSLITPSALIRPCVAVKRGVVYRYNFVVQGRSITKLLSQFHCSQ